MRAKNLSPYLDEKSIQVKGDGAFTILSVNHTFNHLNELEKDGKIDSLRKDQETLASDISHENARLSVLAEKQSLLNENKHFGGQNTGATIAQLKQAMEFYETELSKIKEEEIKRHKSIELMKRDQSRIEQQLKELNESNVLRSSEVEIRISSESNVNAKISLGGERYCC